MQTKIIAEIGVNHNGQLELAMKMIDSAKKAGADIVKFQTFKAERLASSNTPKVAYQLKAGSAEESHTDMLKKLELSESDFKSLKIYCDKVGIEFCSTPFSKEDAEFLCSLGVKTIKVASPDMVDRSLHEFLVTSGKDIILSSGMCTYSEIRETIDIYENGSAQSRLSLLLCTSAYPTKPEDVHLNSLATLRSTFHLPVGLSDHTAGNYCAFAAVALGAVIIEKHFTLDRSLPGPDQAASSIPEEFEDLIKGIRDIEKSLGMPDKELIDVEKDGRLISRKSIIAARDLKKGHIFTENDFAFQRPGDGISPMKFRKLIGKKTLADVKKGRQILAADILDFEE